MCNNILYVLIKNGKLMLVIGARRGRSVIFSRIGEQISQSMWSLPAQLSEALCRRSPP